VQANGVSLRVTEAGEPGAPVVVLCHGFPELAFSWRHQVGALADAGYHVLAPDQRGYGGSDAPAAVAAYTVVELAADVVGLLDDVGAERAALVGHDFGAVVAWTAPLLHPSRFSAVAGLSLPPVPRPRVPTTQAFRRIFGDRFFYILYFQEPGVADAELGADAARTMRRMLAGVILPEGTDLGAAAGLDPSALANDGRGFVDRMPEPDGLPDWLSQAELDHYIEEFSRTGFTGGINWYRNFDRNWELTEQLTDAHVTVPSMFIGGALDPVLLMSPPGVGEPWLDDHRGDVLVDGAGHWVQQDSPGEVNAALLSFLDALDLDRTDTKRN
jgi:pimeloyl-ACP methyl ester carboxylesterase